MLFHSYREASRSRPILPDRFRLEAALQPPKRRRRRAGDAADSASEAHGQSLRRRETACVLARPSR